MARVAFVNGRYELLSEASVSVEDRGFQFADGIYEVCALRSGRLIDFTAHLARLQRSLSAIEIAQPMSNRALRHIVAETIRRNGLKDAIVYIQITRGAAPREHAFPGADIRPSLVVTVRPVSWRAMEERARHGIAVVTRPDLRWARRDIKTIGLLPNVLAKQSARAAGATEAWLVDEAGYVTEGASTNTWIVLRDGGVVTRPLGHDILQGVTRMTLLELLAKSGRTVYERPFTVAEAYAASEAFVSSATNFVIPVVRIDETCIGDGRPGRVSLSLLRSYEGMVQSEALFFAHAARIDV